MILIKTTLYGIIGRVKKGHIHKLVVLEHTQEESRQSRWDITDGDTPTPNIYIRWDDGGEMYISLYLFDGTTISGGFGYYLHKGNYFD